MAIRALVWNENEHEKINALVKKLYPKAFTPPSPRPSTATRRSKSRP